MPSASFSLPPHPDARCSAAAAAAAMGEIERRTLQLRGLPLTAVASLDKSKSDANTNIKRQDSNDKMPVSQDGLRRPTSSSGETSTGSSHTPVGTPEHTLSNSHKRKADADTLDSSSSKTKKVATTSDVKKSNNSSAFSIDSLIGNTRPAAASPVTSSQSSTNHSTSPAMTSQPAANSRVPTTENQLTSSTYYRDLERWLAENASAVGGPDVAAAMMRAAKAYPASLMPYALGDVIGSAANQRHLLSAWR